MHHHYYPGGGGGGMSARQGWHTQQQQSQRMAGGLGGDHQHHHHQVSGAQSLHIPLRSGGDVHGGCSALLMRADVAVRRLVAATATDDDTDDSGEGNGNGGVKRRKRRCVKRVEGSEPISWAYASAATGALVDVDEWTEVGEIERQAAYLYATVYTVTATVVATAEEEKEHQQQAGVDEELGEGAQTDVFAGAVE